MIKVLCFCVLLLLSTYVFSLQIYQHRTVYVGNLGYDATIQNISDLFKAYGNVKMVRIPENKDTGRILGFAYVEMDTDAL